MLIHVTTFFWVKSRLLHFRWVRRVLFVPLLICWWFLICYFKVDNVLINIKFFPMWSGLLNKIILILDNTHDLLFEGWITWSSQVLRYVSLRNIGGCHSIYCLTVVQTICHRVNQIIHSNITIKCWTVILKICLWVFIPRNILKT